MPGVTSGDGRAEIDGFVVDLAWSPRGDSLAAASVEGPITLFDADSGTIRHVLPGHAFGTLGLAWSPDGSRIASAGQDGRLRVWCPDSGREHFAVEAGGAWVERVAWSPSGALLATAAGRSLRIWDARGDLVHRHADAPGTLSALAWRPDSEEIASASHRGINVLEARSGRSIAAFTPQGATLALAWSPTGRLLASGEQDGTARLFRFEPEEDRAMWGYLSKVRHLSWSADGRYLATGGGPAATVWTVQGEAIVPGEPIALGSTDGGVVSALGFSPEGTDLAVGWNDGRLRVWRVGTPSAGLLARDLGAEVTQVAWSRSGRMALGTAAGAIHLF